MAKLYTTERLKEIWEQRKQERLKQKLKQQEQRRKKYQEYYRSLGKDKDKALKDSKLEEKPKELPQFTFQVNGSNTIARENREDSLYTTWDEIKEAEKRGEGKIRWDVLLRVIEETKLWIEKDIKPKRILCRDQN